MLKHPALHHVLLRVINLALAMRHALALQLALVPGATLVRHQPLHNLVRLELGLHHLAVAKRDLARPLAGIQGKRALRPRVVLGQEKRPLAMRHAVPRQLPHVASAVRFRHRAAHDAPLVVPRVHARAVGVLTVNVALGHPVDKAPALAVLGTHTELRHARVHVHQNAMPVRLPGVVDLAAKPMLPPRPARDLAKFVIGRARRHVEPRGLLKLVRDRRRDLRRWVQRAHAKKVDGGVELGGQGVVSEHGWWWVDVSGWTGFLQ